MSSRLRMRFLIPSMVLGSLIAAGPVAGLLGTSTLARVVFVTVLGILTFFLYLVRSLRKQLGISMIALSVECAFLIFLFFQRQFPLRRIVIDLIGQQWAELAWQIAVGLAGALLISGSLMLLWGIRAHRETTPAVE